MGNPDLRDYIDSLGSEEILRIKTPVPRDFLITALIGELERFNRFPVLLFDKVIGCDMPVVTNLFAKRERIYRMVGTSEADFPARWLSAESNRVRPKTVPSGQVKEVVEQGEEMDVTTLPTMWHYESDAGRYVTSGIFVAKDPRTGIRNLSYHRLQVKGPKRMGVSLHSRQHLYHYFCASEAKNQPLEAAVIIGAHPSVLLAASAKTGIDVDEYDIAGGLLGEPVELVRGETVDVEYPANAEIVIEGRILHNLNEDEGPFGEFTGYSTSRSTRNVFETSAICRRKNPYYLNVAAGASADHLNLARIGREAVVLDTLRKRVPNVRNIHYPRSGVNLHCVVSMAPGPEGTARHALMLLFGLDPNVKLAIAVDEDIDITDEAAVNWAMATRMQGYEDIFIVPKVFTIRLDPSSRGGMGSKVGIDATMKQGSDATVLKLKDEHIKKASELLKCL